MIAARAGVSCKALAPVAGMPMIERVVGVLMDHPAIDRIEVALASSEDTAKAAPRLAQWLVDGHVHRSDPESSPARTVAGVMAGLPDDQRLLITTADHALLSAAMLDQFLAGCDRPGVDASAALLPLTLVESKYPTMKRTGLRLRDGRYSGCNLFLLRAGAGARALLSFWRQLESLRKSPWRMARVVGPGMLLRYGLRLLTLHEALASIGAKSGATLAPVILDIPESAIDIDTREDLAFVEKLLG